MNESEFYLYVMVDRQGIIDQNKQKIHIFKNQLECDINYQKALDALNKIKRKYKLITKKIEENIIHYELDQENNNIITYSNQIQSLTEMIMEKEEKIRFVKLMLEVLEREKGINPLSLFIKFYHQNQQIAWEELHENVSISKQFLLFLHQFCSIWKKQKQQSKNLTFYTRLSNLFVYYDTTKENLLSEKNNCENVLQQERQFKMNYLQIQKKLQKDKDTAYILIQQLTKYVETASVERTFKQNEIARLEQENRDYQKEIEELRQIVLNKNEFFKKKSILSNGRQYTMQHRLMNQ